MFIASLGFYAPEPGMEKEAFLQIWKAEEAHEVIPPVWLRGFNREDIDGLRIRLEAKGFVVLF